jgi:hypothetical protein
MTEIMWKRNDRKFQWELVDDTGKVHGFITDEFAVSCSAEELQQEYHRLSDLLFNLNLPR